MLLTAIILTYNEDKHIQRCIESLQEVANRIYVVDSYSNDRTMEILETLQVHILQHEWKNHSDQFNWALQNIAKDTEWVLRIDADEIVTKQLTNEILEKLPKVKNNINGIYIGRKIIFQKRIMRYGGLGSLKNLRIIRFGKGRCENRLMDEHLIIESGSTEIFKGNVIDENLNDLTWWINKHNLYATKEAYEMIALEHENRGKKNIDLAPQFRQDYIKRWVKENIYKYLPLQMRAFLYFLYRYFFLFGFLDGWAGLNFHILQGFWYRYLVDLKIIEIKYMHKKNINM